MGYSSADDMTKGTCKYFNGIQNDECKKDVNYQNLAGDEKGMAIRLPCIQSHKTTIVCNDMDMIKCLKCPYGISPEKLIYGYA